MTDFQALLTRLCFRAHFFHDPFCFSSRFYSEKTKTAHPSWFLIYFIRLRYIAGVPEHILALYAGICKFKLTFFATGTDVNFLLTLGKLLLLVQNRTKL